MRKKGESQAHKVSSSVPYILLAFFVFAISVIGAIYVWRLVVQNLQYFSAERLAVFVLVTGLAISVVLFRLLYLFAISKDEARRRRIAVQNQLNSTVLRSIGDGVLATDVNGTILFINEALKRMIGLQETAIDENIDQLIKVQDEKGRELKDKERPTLSAIKMGKRIATTVTDPQYYFVRNDKTRFPGMVTATPVIDNNQIAGAVLVVRDVTTEQEIDKAKNEFVSLASHQLRTPLSTIHWYVESLLKGRTGKINKEQKQYLQTVYDGSERMTDLVNALLNVSRIELGTFSIEPKLVDFVALAKVAIDDFKPVINEKKLVVETQFNSTIPKINADVNLLGIIFQNLLSNAVKYTPANGKIFFGIEKQDSNVLITVSDSGYGIPKDEQDQIFGKLFRARNAKEKEVDGNGLGLYITKSVLEHSGGKIWFISPAADEYRSEKIENPGTTFYVTIPLSGMKRREGEKKLS
jgi:PAS domain S-box-containing protein